MDNNDSVELKNFHECLVYINSRPCDRITTEFNKVLKKEKDRDNISEFFENWKNVFESANDLLSNWQHIRLNEREYKIKMRNCCIALQFLQSSTNFNIFNTALLALNSVISKLAKPVRSLVKFDVPNGLFSTPKDCDYKRYIEIGKHLSHDSKVIEISDELRTLRVPQNFSRYAAIIGPSLLGKTQFAFALSILRKVIYVNLTYEKETEAQKIYKSFCGISDLFKQVMHQDSRDHIKESLLVKSANELVVFRGKLLTLGLLAHLMKFSRPLSQEHNWFDQFVSIQSVKIEKLSFDDFLTRFKQEELLDYVLFIDEFPSNFELICFLRNIARVTGLPCVLAATNSNIGNMIGTSMQSSSRQELFRPWVKIISKLPCSEPYFLAKFSSFEFNGVVRTLESFIVNGTVDVESLFGFLNISHSSVKTKELFKLLFEQGKTCLPGILYYIFAKLNLVFKDSNRIAGNSIDETLFDRQVWVNICKLIYKEARNRKKLIHPHSMFASCYAMSCGIACMDSLFNSEFRTAFIDKHFYRLGTASTPAIEPLTICNNTLYVDLGTDYVVSTTAESNRWRCNSYFPKFHEDLFVHIVTWGNVTDLSVDLGIFESSNKSLAQLLEELPLENVFSNANALKNNFLAQETLICWAVGNASHYDISGKTTGLEFIRQFSGHIQSIPVNCEYFPRELLCTSDITPPFSQFFNRITVPYGVESSLDDSFIKCLSNYMDVGQFYRCKDQEGFDLRFPIRFDGVICEALAECKYQDVETDLPLIMEYSLKAIEKKIRLTLFITSRMNSELKNYYNGLLQNQCSSLGIPFSRNNDRSPFIIPKFKLNHYAICFSPGEPLGINKLRINTLFEHDENPDGCFIILETNLCIPKI